MSVAANRGGTGYVADSGNSVIPKITSVHPERDRFAGAVIKSGRETDVIPDTA